MIGDLEPSIKEWIKKQGMLCKITPLEGDGNLDQVLDRLPVEVLVHLFPAASEENQDQLVKSREKHILSNLSCLEKTISKS